MVWKCLRLLTRAPWLAGLGRICAGGHKHTALAGRWTSWSAAYAPQWCQEYASLTAKAPQMLKMFANLKPIMATDSNYKRVSSVSLLRHWPEHPSFYLTGDMEAARMSALMSKVSVLDSRFCPLYDDDKTRLQFLSRVNPARAVPVTVPGPVKFLMLLLTPTPATILMTPARA